MDQVCHEHQVFLLPMGVLVGEKVDLEFLPLSNGCLDLDLNVAPGLELDEAPPGFPRS